MSSKAVKENLNNFRLFLYNPKNHTVLYRNKWQWLRVTIFYIIFYGCLTCAFSFMLWVFLLTIEEERPTRSYYHDGYKHVMLQNPGISMRPYFISRRGVRITSIKFDANNKNTYAKYVNCTDENYECVDTYVMENVRNKAGEHDVKNCDGTLKGTCNVSETDFGNCTGPNYGFDDGEPCLLFKLNKIIGWEPDSDWIENGHIPFTCGESTERNISIGNPQYFPPDGFPVQCFPFCGSQVSHPNFTIPSIMVKFKDFPANRGLRVHCKAAKDAFPHNSASRKDKLMSIEFNLEIKK